MFNELGHGRINAFSAGSQPTGAVNTDAVEKLRREGHETDGLRSKSWQEFTGPDADDIDIVIAVCDSAAGESCPLWNGTPITVHWGIPDPAGAIDEEIGVAFDTAYQQLRTRVEQTLELPLRSLEHRYWKDALQRIHEAAHVKETRFR